MEKYSKFLRNIAELIEKGLFTSKDLKKEVENLKNIDQVISLFRPLIFWKEKEIVKQQILNCSSEEMEKLIYQINEIEIQVKKNYSNSLNIIYDFILNKSIKSNNFSL